MSQTQPKYTPKKSGGGGGSKSILIVIIVLAVVALAGAGWYIFLRSTPEKTVKQFMQAREKGDAETVVKLLSEKSKVDSKSFTEGINQAAGQEKAKSSVYKIGSATITGTDATVPVSFEMSKEQAAIMGSEFTLPFCLVKEGMQWKVDSKKTEDAMMAEIMKKMGGMLGEIMKQGAMGGMQGMPMPPAGPGAVPARPVR
jgi:hypothetical protein